MGNQDNIRIYGYDGTDIWFGPKGSTFPASLTATPDVAFIKDGWLGPDGINLKIEKDVKKWKALQGGAEVKQGIASVGMTFDWYCMEETAAIISRMHAGQPWTKTGTGASAYGELNFMTDQNKVLELAMILDLVSDTGSKNRYLSSVVSLVYQGDMKVANFDDVAARHFEATVLAGGVNKLLSNSPGVLAGLPA